MKVLSALLAVGMLGICAAAEDPTAAENTSASATRYSEIDSYYPREAFAPRRAKLAEKIGDATAIVLAAEEPAAYAPFRQNNTFFYFTGLATPGAVLVVQGGAKPKSILFLPHVSGHAMKSEGPRLTPEIKDLDKLLGVDQVIDISRFYLMLAYQAPATVYTLLTPEELSEMSRDRSLGAQAERFANGWDGRLSREQMFVQKLRTQFPAIGVKDLTPIIDELRWVKDAAEIRALRDSGKIGAEGVAQAIRSTKPGMCEQEVADVAHYVWMRRGAQGDAYFPIVASGDNSLRWHYHTNDRRLKANDLVLIDYAPDFEYMNTDITRVWPVSGRFSEEQTRYYNAVLETHRALIDAVKPGVTIAQLNEIGKTTYTKHGIGDKWLWPGHFVGMSTHDPGPYDRPFVPGVVFNVEPLLDLPDKGYHLRLEDTVLVTDKGHELITTQGLPWELEEIYKLRDQGSTLGLPPLADGGTRINCQ